MSDGLDKILEYFDVEEDEDEKTCTIKEGYIFRYEGFDTFDIRIFSITEHSVYFITTGSDWKETKLMGLTTLKECKLYKLEAVPLNK